MPASLEPDPHLPRQLRAPNAATRLLAALAEASGEAVFIVDPDRNIVFFNRRAEALTGFPRREVLGRGCLAGFRCPRCLAACTLFDRGRIVSRRVEIFRRDGSRLQVRKTGVVVRDAAGQAIAAVELFRPAGPAADRPAAAETAGAPAWDLDRMMAALGRGVALLDRDFHLDRASATFAALLGQPLPELRGRPANELLGEELFVADCKHPGRGLKTGVLPEPN